jgi:hypothetical protein
VQPPAGLGDDLDDVDRAVQQVNAFPAESGELTQP